MYNLALMNSYASTQRRRCQPDGYTLRRRTDLAEMERACPADTALSGDANTYYCRTLIKADKYKLTMAGGSIYVSSELGSLATDPLRRLPTTTEYVIGDGV